MASKLAGLDMKRFHERLQSLSEVAKIERKDFVLNEARLLTEELVKRSVSKPEKAKKDIRIDRGRMMAPKKGASRIIPWTRLNIIMRRGNVSRKRPFVDAVIAIISNKTALAHRGELAAGWLTGGNPLKAIVRNAGARKMMGKGHGMINIKHGIMGTWVTVVNSTSWLSHMPGFLIAVQKAINTRAGSMRARANTIIKKGIAYKVKK